MSRAWVSEIVSKLEAEKARLTQRLVEFDAAIRTIAELEPTDEEIGFRVTPTIPRPSMRASAAKSRPCGCPQRGPHLLVCKLSTRKAAKAAPATTAPPKLFVRRPPGKEAAAGEERCDVCGRDDLKSKYSFHRAPEPCLLPCAGGPPPKSAEDRAEGLHSKKNCPNCGRKEASA